MRFVFLVFLVLLGINTIALAYILFYFLLDIFHIHRDKIKSKEIPYEFEEDTMFDEDPISFEPFLPELDENALLDLKPDRVSFFVQERMIPAASKILGNVTQDHVRQAEYLITSYIELLLDTAPRDEFNFITLLTLLEATDFSLSDKLSPTEMFVEDSKFEEINTHFYTHFLLFKEACEDKDYVVNLATNIVRENLVKIYGYVPSSSTHAY